MNVIASTENGQGVEYELPAGPAGRRQATKLMKASYDPMYIGERIVAMECTHWTLSIDCDLVVSTEWHR